MLIQIDASEQMINSDRIESIMLSDCHENSMYKVVMFNGDIFYVRKNIIMTIQEYING